MGDEMHIPPIKKDWNINTVISGVGFVITLATMAIGYGQFTERMEQGQREFAAYKLTTDTRIIALEGLGRQMDSLGFRMSAAETTNSAIARGLDELQSAVATQSGDLRVVREILQRIERQSSPAVFAPMASVE